MKVTLIAITIYLVGVVIGFNMGFDLVKNNNKKCGVQTTYGDVAVCAGLSLGSWANVGALLIFKLAKSDFFKTPLTSNKQNDLLNKAKGKRR